MSKWKSLDSLAEHVSRIKEMEAYTAPLVVQARIAGASWLSISQALGVSRQAAEKMYKSQVPAPLDEDVE